MCNVRCARALVCADAGRGGVRNGRAAVILVIVSSSDTPFALPSLRRRAATRCLQPTTCLSAAWRVRAATADCSSQPRSECSWSASVGGGGQTSDRLTHVAPKRRVGTCVRARACVCVCSFSNRWDNNIIIIYVYCKFVNSGRIAIEPAAAEREAIKRTDDIAAAARYVLFSMLPPCSDSTVVTAAAAARARKKGNDNHIPRRRRRNIPPAARGRFRRNKTFRHRSNDRAFHPHRPSLVRDRNTRLTADDHRRRRCGLLLITIYHRIAVPVVHSYSEGGARR